MGNREIFAKLAWDRILVFRHPHLEFPSFCETRVAFHCAPFHKVAAVALDDEGGYSRVFFSRKTRNSGFQASTKRARSCVFRVIIWTETEKTQHESEFSRLEQKCKVRFVNYMDRHNYSGEETQLRYSD